MGILIGLTLNALIVAAVHLHLYHERRKIISTTLHNPLFKPGDAA